MSAMLESMALTRRMVVGGGSMVVLGTIAAAVSPKDWFRKYVPESANVLEREIESDWRIYVHDDSPVGGNRPSRPGNTTQLDNTSGGDDVEDLNGRFIGWVADPSMTQTYSGKNDQYFVRIGVGRTKEGNRAKVTIRVEAFLPEVSTRAKKIRIKIDGVPDRSSPAAKTEKVTHNGVEGILVAFQSKALVVGEGNKIQASVDLGGKTYDMNEYSYAADDFIGKDPGFSVEGLNLS